MWINCGKQILMAIIFPVQKILLFCCHQRSVAEDPATTSSSSVHTHLPRGPRTRVGRRWPRVKTGERLSRIGRGEIHALIGGKLVRGLAIKSRGRNRQLQKQGQEHSRWTASTEGQEAHQQPQTSGEGRRKEGQKLILQKKREERVE